MKKFPTNFLWGAAMSAPQTEGHSLLNGKSASTWDHWFETNPEKFNANQGPADTSNIYELYKEDCQRMEDIGLNSIRTSIAWTRLLPDGKTLNPEAVAFYRDYFQEIRNHGVEPIINLFHFDMPMWLMEKGGWETRESVDAFAFYAKTAFEQFGDLVSKWTTFNEPLVHVECGYLFGYHYPAIVDFKKAVQVGYHTLMAHTCAVKAFREVLPQGEIGIILNISPAYARSESDADQQAKLASDLLNTRSFLDPAVHGHLPEELIALIKENELTPETQAEDTQLMAENTVDFIGLNYYQPRRVQAPTNPAKPAKMPSDLYGAYDWPEKRINPYRGWEIYPEAMYDVAIMMKNDYKNIPWFVSENGMGVADEERFLDENGMIQDDYRIEFMKEHLDYLHQGIQEGSNCFGYQTWTFVDCWSWLNGYRNRYGFYRVDLDNQFQRSVKKSGLWFKQVVQDNGYTN
ncbi:glycoside hydrolase family 1 protein [Candidatus Enterococcus willemsii]|uniref:6-phospho-beta-glucosidase n=1 Tax=Candidatus Enterococcus willemsii TaxID=1857215 RepID=A0ABQ6Z0T0_9ENTE|nr:glycoside hydrolase family 1 protein [Enterococcus sp. CU12B]KAF1304623.1 6-phospho-beta-glucosidase [Enterococcus sp. CU12B]